MSGFQKVIIQYLSCNSQCLYASSSYCVSGPMLSASHILTHFIIRTMQNSGIIIIPILQMRKLKQWCGQWQVNWRNQIRCKTSVEHTSHPASWTCTGCSKAEDLAVHIFQMGHLEAQRGRGSTGNKQRSWSPKEKQMKVIPHHPEPCSRLPLRRKASVRGGSRKEVWGLRAIDA